MIQHLISNILGLKMRYPRLYKVFKYIVSGGSAAIVDIFFLYVFTDIVGLWYVLSAILAFIIAFFVSFLLQKYWTFGDKSNHNIHRQGLLYLFISLLNLCLNTALVYFFTDIVTLHYLLSQFITGIILAFSSYFIYKRFVFNKYEIIDNHTEGR